MLAEDVWNLWFDKAYDYINKHKARPKANSKDYDTKRLSHWIVKQNRFYREVSNIMKNKIIYNKWDKLVNEYPRLLYDKITEWKYKLSLVEDYICGNFEKPVETYVDDNGIHIGKWLQRQKYNHKKKIKLHNIKEIYDIWEQFINDPLYKDILYNSRDDKVSWGMSFKNLTKYIRNNNKLPNKNDDLYKWLIETNEQYNQDELEEKQLEKYEKFIMNNIYSKLLKGSKII